MDDMPGRSVIRLKGVSKSYGKRRVLDKFDLTVGAGEFVAVMGSSGSGKSTLLNIIGLLDSADSGSIVELFGEPSPKPGSRKARQLLRYKMAYVFQHAALVDYETVEANMRLAQGYSEEPRKRRAEQRKAALRAVGLDGSEKQKVYQLSGGEQQRLAIACMQMHPSELVLADEPTGSLEECSREMIMSLLGALHDQGRALVVVAHDRAVAERADRIVRL